MPRRLAYLLYALTAICWIVAFTLTHLPPGDLPPEIHGPDKVMHFVGYLGLAGTLYMALRAAGYRWAAVIAVLICLNYGIFDECTQPLFGRDRELGDWVADACGTVAGTLIAMGVVYWLRRLYVSWRGHGGGPASIPASE